MNNHAVAAIILVIVAIFAAAVLLPRLPEVSWSVKGEILAVLGALAFLAWAISL